MQSVESFQGFFGRLPESEDDFMLNALDQLVADNLAKFSDGVRDIVVDTAVRVLSLTDDEVREAAEQIDRLMTSDDFLNRDTKISLMEISEKARERGGNYKLELRIGLAERIARRRLADFSDYDPTYPISYSETIGQDSFRNGIEFVRKSVKKLA